MDRVFGIETEYGITVDGQDEVDVVHESIELVKGYTDGGCHMKWDYRLEDPHQDARGFRAAELLQDTDEASYFEIDRSRPLTFEEIKSDLVLCNGARFYNDHAHPEYSTPECGSLAELIAQDKAGERVLAECVRRRNEKLGSGKEVKIFKNNTDFNGHSYGCHDNYLVSREIPWSELVSAMLPFLVTRQIVAGAGKVGYEAENAGDAGSGFQISQRSDFFTVICSIDTMNRRPLVNTRDEPHADPARFRRFHVILGDANMSEFSTALKIGSTALVLALVEKGAYPKLELRDPVQTTRDLSRDSDWKWRVPMADGSTLSGLEIQRRYLDAIEQHLAPTDPESRRLLQAWAGVLDDLGNDPLRCADRLDWVAKYELLELFRTEEKLGWDDPWLQSLDLEYHNVQPDEGLYYELQREERILRWIEEKSIHEALFHPPESTRAFFRGRCVARFHDQIRSVHWDKLVFDRGAADPLRVPLGDAIDGERLKALNHAVRDARDYDDFLSRIMAVPTKF